MYPTLEIHLDTIAENARAVVALCASHDIRVCGVVKAVGGDARIADALLRAGVDSIADSRLADLKRLGSVSCPKLLLRAPLIQEAADVVRLADVSINTELATLQALDDACQQTGIDSHGIMLMCDLGDLREGFVDEGELLAAARFVQESPRLHLYGIGANLNCLSFIVPDEDKMAELVATARRVCKATGAGNLVVSGGNSSNLHLLMTHGGHEGIDELRLGEALLFGRERTTYEYLPGTRNDAFVFKAGVIEVKDKPSLPWGTSGADSYGNRHEFEDRGVRRRAIVAFGHQDAEAEVMWPLDAGIEIVDSSSDHTVIDVTDAERAVCVGDIVAFRCGYHAAARAYASPYVEKAYV